MMTRRTLLLATGAAAFAAGSRKTKVGIVKDGFTINGKPTYKGRTWNGKKIEGLLMNSRMVQATYDDLNPETAPRWAYPDTGKWDAERNVREFLAAMPEWRKHGLLAVTVNLQGGSPQGYSKAQPWENNAFDPDGSLRPAYMDRLRRVLTRADELGMVAIVGIFYFGQDQRLRDEEAVKTAVMNTVKWLREGGYTNVLLEINNECNVSYDHAILKPERVHELIVMAKAQGILTGTSYGGNTVAKANVVRASDFILMHGNGVKDPKRIAQMVREVRQVEGYRPMPVVFNEDDHFDFDKPENNMVSAIGEYASWGYFDPEGYQCPPVKWGLDTDRKRGFFKLVKEVTGA